MKTEGRVSVPIVDNRTVVVEEALDEHGGTWIAISESTNSYRIVMSRRSARRFFELALALAAKKWDDDGEEDS